MAVGRPRGALILQWPPQKSIDSTTMPPRVDAPKPTPARNEDEEPPQCRGVDISSLRAGSGTCMLFAGDKRILSLYPLSTSASQGLADTNYHGFWDVCALSSLHPQGV